MANQDGPSRSINMWLRWVRGWASESQILCRQVSDFGELQTDLVPLETSSSGKKAVIIKFSDKRALVIESRRETKFNLQNTSKLIYDIEIDIDF